MTLLADILEEPMLMQLRQMNVKGTGVLLHLPAP